MKNKALFLTSLIGGAIFGSAITCALKSAKGRELRSLAHERIIHEIKHLHAHMSGMCHCTEDGECKCNLPEAEGSEQSNG